MKEQLKKLSWVILALIVVLAIAFNPFTNKPKHEHSSQQKRTQTEQVSSTNDNENEKSTTEKSDRNLAMLKKFGEKWVNYHSIIERNQSVKAYFTEDGAKESTLDTDPHVEITATGSIDTISQDLTNKNHFVLIGTEETRKNPTKIILEVDTITEKDKALINHLSVSYVRQAY